MRKKSSSICIALAALVALAAAPSQSLATNDPDLTEGGSMVSAGVEIIGTNVGELLITDANTNVLIRCTTFIQRGSSIHVSPTTVSEEISTFKVGGTGVKPEGQPKRECTGSFGNVSFTANPATNGLPWCLQSDSTDATDAFRIRGGKCSEASRAIRFVLDSTTVGECAYQRTAAIPGTYTTGGTAAELSISKIEFPKVSGSFLCPGTGYLDMTFSLETSNGTALTIS